MKYDFEDGTWIILQTLKQLRANPNRRVSALFRDYRKHFDILGDYVILSGIAEGLKITKLPLIREQFQTACKQSEEYNGISKAEKMMWLNLLTKEDKNDTARNHEITLITSIKGKKQEKEVREIPMVKNTIRVVVVSS